MKTTRMERQQRKQAIVEAALPLFAQHGFSATTTRQLAEAAGVSEALIYKHFPSKESLYAEIKGFGREGNDPEMIKVLSREPSTRTLVLAVYATLIRFVLGKGGGQLGWEIRVRLMLHSCLEDGSFMRFIFHNAFQDALTRLEKSIQVAEEAGDLVRAPVSKTNGMMFTHHVAMMIGSMHLPELAAIEYDGSKQELLEQAMWYVLRGLGFREAAIQAHVDLARLESDLKSAIG